MKYSIVFAICMIAYCNCDELVDYRLSLLNNRALHSVYTDGGSETGAPTNPETPSGISQTPPGISETTPATLGTTPATLGTTPATLGTTPASPGTQPATTETPPPKFNCSTAGLQCSDCKTVVNCLDMGGRFLEITTVKCGDGETCDAGACTTKPNYKCGDLKNIGFKCNSIGMFPDPWDCQRYLICAPGIEKPFEGKCDSGRAYDMTRTYCSHKLGANRICPASTIVPICKTPGSTFVLSNKSIFGMCLVENVNGKAYLVPRLFSCPNGGTYFPATYKCA